MNFDDVIRQVNRLTRTPPQPLEKNLRLRDTRMVTVLQGKARADARLKNPEYEPQVRSLLSEWRRRAPVPRLPMASILRHPLGITNQTAAACLFGVSQRGISAYEMRQKGVSPFLNHQKLRGRIHAAETGLELLGLERNDSIPPGIAWVSLCDLNEGDFCEISQLIGLRILKQNQFIGINRSGRIIAQNRQAWPKAKWYRGHIAEVFEQHGDEFRPGIVFYDACEAANTRKLWLNAGRIALCCPGGTVLLVNCRLRGPGHTMTKPIPAETGWSLASRVASLGPMRAVRSHSFAYRNGGNLYHTYAFKL